MLSAAPVAAYYNSIKLGVFHSGGRMIAALIIAGRLLKHFSPETKQITSCKFDSFISVCSHYRSFKPTITVRPVCNTCTAKTNDISDIWGVGEDYYVDSNSVEIYIIYYQTELITLHCAVILHNALQLCRNIKQICAKQSPYTTTAY